VSSPGTPTGDQHHFLVRFPDGFEASLTREKSKLEDADMAFHESEYQRLRAELQAAHDSSSLPESPSEETRKALNELLVRVRLKVKSAAHPNG
jgi:hypothetical protein